LDMNQEEGRSKGRQRSVRPPRWLLITVGVIVLLLVGGYVTLKVLFPPEKLRAMVAPRVEEAVGRDVEIGSVSLRVFPRIAVRMEDFAVSNPPGFGDEPAMSLAALELQVALWPLFRREIELNTVRLIEPIVRYEVLADGRNNFEGIGAADTASGEATAESGGAPAAAGLVVSDLVLRDGTILYTDRASGRGARLRMGASLSAERAEGDRRSLVSEGVLDMTEIMALLPDMAEDSIAIPSTRVEYELFADLPGDSARLRRLDIVLGEVPLSGTGTLTGLRSEVKNLDFTLESGEVEIAELLASLPQRLRREDLEASGLARLSLQAQGQLGADAPLPIRGTLDVRDLAASLADYGQVLEGGSGEVAFSRETLSIPAFTGQVLGRDWELELTVTDFETRAVEGRVEGGLSLARLAELRDGGLPMEGDVQANLSFSGSLREVSGLRATGPLRLSNVSYQSESLAVPARIESAVVQLTGSGVSVERMPIKLGGSDLTLSLSGPQLLAWSLRDSVAKAASPPSVQFSVTSNRLDVSEIMVEDTSKIGYGALVSARLAGRQVAGRDPGAIAADRYRVPAIPPVNATGTVRIAEFVNPPTQARNVDFAVELRNGQLQLRELTADVYGGKFTGGASVDLSGGKPPYGLRYDMSLTGARAATFLERWTRLGAVTDGLIDFRISGTGSVDETLLPVADVLDASGFTAVKEGRFTEFPIARALTNRFNAGPDLFGAFQSLGGGYTIENGRFVLDDWELAASQVTASVGGSAGLGGTLDLDLQLAVPPSLLQKAGLVQGGGGPLGNLIGQLAKDDRPIQLGIGIGGSMGEPRLEIDTDALQQALQQRLQGAGKDLLKRLIPPN